MKRIFKAIAYTNKLLFSPRYVRDLERCEALGMTLHQGYPKCLSTLSAVFKVSWDVANLKDEETTPERIVKFAYMERALRHTIRYIIWTSVADEETLVIFNELSDGEIKPNKPLKYNSERTARLADFAFENYVVTRPYTSIIASLYLLDLISSIEFKLFIGNAQRLDYILVSERGLAYKAYPNKRTSGVLDLTELVADVNPERYEMWEMIQRANGVNIDDLLKQVEEKIKEGN